MISIRICTDHLSQDFRNTLIISNHIKYIINLIYQHSMLSLPNDISIVLIPESMKPSDRWQGAICPVTLAIYLCADELIEELRMVLMHELIHFEQIHLKYLKYDILADLIYWKNTPYPIGTDDWETYSKLPWEADAFARESVIYERCNILQGTYNDANIAIAA